MPKSGNHNVNNIDSFFRVRPSKTNIREGETVSFLEDGVLVKQEKRNGVVYEQKFTELSSSAKVTQTTGDVTNLIVAGSSSSEGDVTGITAGTGLSGGGSGGNITLNIDSTVTTLTGTQTLTNKTLTAPTLTTPALGTPASGVMTNVTGTATNLTAGSATLASTVTVSDSTANTNFPVVFHNESNVLLDDTSALTYNPSSGTLVVPNLNVSGTTTTVDTTNLVVSDKLIELSHGATGTPAAEADSGIIIERGGSDNVFIGWDEGSDRVRFAITDSVGSDSTVSFSSNANIQASRLYGDVTGNVTGSLSGGTVTSLSSPIALGEGGTGGGSAAEARSSLGVDPAGTDNSTNVTLAGSLNYITLSGQQITRNAIDLTADVTGTLPVGNGGTGATTLTSNSLLTGNGTSAIQAESGLTYNGSTLGVTGEIDVSDIIHANGNSSNRLDLDDDSDSASVNQVTLAGVNNVNIVIDQTNNGTGDFQVRARPTTASDLDTASMILDMDKVTAIFNQDTYQQFQIGGANRFKILEAGVQVQSGSLGVGVTAPPDNGIIQSSGAIICGDGDGDIALTTNDGGGNANITFNHTNQDPDNNGQSGRIHVNVDATSSEGEMVFETSSSDVTGGATDVALVDSLKIAHDYIEVPNIIRHMGDTHTNITFTGDAITLNAGGETLLTLTESSQDVVKLGDGGDVDINLNDDMFVSGASGNVGINQGNKLYFDGINVDDVGQNTYIQSDTADNLKFVVGNRNMIEMIEDDSQDMVVIGNGATDVDFIVEDDAGAAVLTVDSGTSKTTLHSLDVTNNVGLGDVTADNVASNSFHYNNSGSLGAEAFTIGASGGVEFTAAIALANADFSANSSDGAVLNLKTTLTEQDQVDILGRINFSAPVSGNHTDDDSRKLAASIVAQKSAVFSDTSNQTDMIFQLGVSEIATEKFRILSDGKIKIGNAYTLPAADGSANQILKTNGSGTVSFAAESTPAVTSYTNTGDNRVLTSVGGTTINGESNLTFDGTDLTIAHSSGAIKFAAAHATDKIQLYNGGNEKIGTSANTIIFTGDNHKFIDTASSETMQWTSSNNYLTIHETGASKGSHLRLATDNSDFIFTASGGTNQLSIYDVNGTANRLVVNSSGTFHFQHHVTLQATKKLYLDGGSNTYIDEPSGDQLRLVAGGTEVLKGYSSGVIDIYGGSINRSIELGANRTGDAASYIDFIGDTTYTDYGFRVIRNAGAAGVTQLLHRGTGELQLTTQESAPIRFRTGGSDALMVNTSQNVGLKATGKLFFDGVDGGGDTYIHQSAGDVLDFVVGGQQMLRLYEGGTDYVHVDDNTRLGVGNDPDLYIYHTSGASYVKNVTGMLSFQQTAQDQDIRFSVNDGGSTSNILTLNAASSRVGIGTTSPSLKLDVAGDIGLKNNATYLYSKDASGTSTRMFGINGSNNTYIGPIDNYAGGSILYGANANVVDHIFYTGGAERMRIKTSTGNVGIGTNSPSAKLHVDGSAIFDTDTGNQPFYITRIGTLGQALKMYVDDNNAVFESIQDETSGYVGNFKFVMDSGSTAYTGFLHGTAEKMRIQSDGNVGIGTNSPGAAIEVKDYFQIEASSSYMGILGFNRNVNTGAILNGSYGAYQLHNYQGKLHLQVYNSSGTAIDQNALVVDNSANVGIGTSSPGSYNSAGDNLVVAETSGGAGITLASATNGSGHILFADSTSGTGAYDGFIRYDHTTSSMRFAAAGGVERMRIDSAGRVMIGDTSVHYTGVDLQVGSTSDGQNGIQIQTSTTGYGYVLFGDGTGASAYRGQISYKHGDDYMNFITSGSERMRIDATGTKFSENFSSTDDVLHINPANGHNRTMELAGDAINVTVTGGASNTLKLNEDGGDVDICNGDLYIDESANAVGIGTTSPQSKFQVKQTSTNSAITSVNPAIVINNQGGSYTDGHYYSSIMFAKANSNGATKGAAIAPVIQDSGNSTELSFSTIVNGSALTEALRIDKTQDAHFDQDVIAFSTTPSDIRLKENFTKIENGLDVVSKLEGHTFNWKKGGERLSAGFKAQEVEKILPHLVDEKKLPLKADDDKEYKILRYEEMIPYLVEAIKEQQVQINELKTKIGEQNG